MKKTVIFLISALLLMPAFAAPGDSARRSMSDQMVAAPRATASVGQLNATSAAKKSSIKVETDMIAAPVADEQNRRDKEKEACQGNNIGIGNTFVWASRYSNSSSYASMVEDVNNPENNVCFVKVDMKSSDSRINLSDIPSKYFVMGNTINCGSWVDEDALQKRILDAKKTGRALATVGGVVGGAGLGVGAMELFGNKLIGGKVMGQKDEKLTETEVFVSQMLVLKQENRAEYDKIIKELESIQSECKNNNIKECAELDYAALLKTQDNQ